jgi:hypothetical protein
MMIELHEACCSTLSKHWTEKALCLKNGRFTGQSCSPDVLPGVPGIPAMGLLPGIGFGGGTAGTGENFIEPLERFR